MVLFAPLAVFFIRVISGETGLYDVSYKVVSTSVGVFLGIPLGAAIISRFAIRWLTGSPAPRGSRKSSCVSRAPSRLSAYYTLSSSSLPVRATPLSTRSY